MDEQSRARVKESCLVYKVGAYKHKGKAVKRGLSFRARGELERKWGWPAVFEIDDGVQGDVANLTFLDEVPERPQVSHQRIDSTKLADESNPVPTLTLVPNPNPGLSLSPQHAAAKTPFFVRLKDNRKDIDEPRQSVSKSISVASESSTAESPGSIQDNPIQDNHNQDNLNPQSNLNQDNPKHISPALVLPPPQQQAAAPPRPSKLDLLKSRLLEKTMGGENGAKDEGGGADATVKTLSPQQAPPESPPTPTAGPSPTTFSSTSKTGDLKESQSGADPHPDINTGTDIDRLDDDRERRLSQTSTSSAKKAKKWGLKALAKSMGSKTNLNDGGAHDDGSGGRGDDGVLKKSASRASVRKSFVGLISRSRTNLHEQDKDAHGPEKVSKDFGAPVSILGSGKATGEEEDGDGQGDSDESDTVSISSGMSKKKKKWGILKSISRSIGGSKSDLIDHDEKEKKPKPAPAIEKEKEAASSPSRKRFLGIKSPKTDWADQEKSAEKVEKPEKDSSSSSARRSFLGLKSHSSKSDSDEKQKTTSSSDPRPVSATPLTSDPRPVSANPLASTPPSSKSFHPTMETIIQIKMQSEFDKIMQSGNLEDRETAAFTTSPAKSSGSQETATPIRTVSKTKPEVALEALKPPTLEPNSKSTPIAVLLQDSNSSAADAHTTAAKISPSSLEARKAMFEGGKMTANSDSLAPQKNITGLKGSPVDVNVKQELENPAKEGQDTEGDDGNGRSSEYSTKKKKWGVMRSISKAMGSKGDLVEGDKSTDKAKKGEEGEVSSGRKSFLGLRSHKSKEELNSTDAERPKKTDESEIHSNRRSFLGLKSHSSKTEALKDSSTGDGAKPIEALVVKPVEITETEKPKKSADAAEVSSGRKSFLGLRSHKSKEELNSPVEPAKKSDQDSEVSEGRKSFLGFKSRHKSETPKPELVKLEAAKADIIVEVPLKTNEVLVDEAEDEEPISTRGSEYSTKKSKKWGGGVMKSLSKAIGSRSKEELNSKSDGQKLKK